MKNPIWPVNRNTYPVKTLVPKESSIQGDVNMQSNITIGSYVKLISLPNWLLEDLPENEQQELIRCVGNVFQVSDVDLHGYYWIGFGITTYSEQDSFYSGHSFCVTRECLEII